MGSKFRTIISALGKPIALGLCMFGLMSVSARAAEEYYVFKSVLSTASANWCIDVPQAQVAAQLVVSACSGKPNQTFGYEGGGTLTNSGYCLDGLASKPNQSPSAGDPVVIAECDGSDRQVWRLQPFHDRPDVFAIANPDGLCVTVDGTIAEGTPLALAQCAEMDSQGWLRSVTASAEPEIYWFSGHRYCWYDDAWHGPGWYWCGENLHVGIGWGGPIGWHWWHHHGHPPHPHPLPPHPLPPHPPLHPHVTIHPHPHVTIHPHPHVMVHPHIVPRGHPVARPRRRH